MNNIISRENILRERLLNSKEGELVVDLLVFSEELGYEGCIDKFSLSVQQYIEDLLAVKESYKKEHVYTYIMNVCYVVELYLKGYYNKETYMGYEQFVNLVDEGKTREILDDVKEKFMLHVHRLKKMIVKSKKKITRGNQNFLKVRKLLEELDDDLNICLRYPITTANLCNFYFGREYGNVGSNLVNRLVGFVNFEKEVYSIYNELYILSKMDQQAVNDILKKYIAHVGSYVQYNVFEKVINNYLFAIPYSEKPEKLEITETEAKLLIGEIKIGTLNADELISQLIEKYDFNGFKAEYLREYGKFLQMRIDDLKEANWFSELFFVTQPGGP